MGKVYYGNGSGNHKLPLYPFWIRREISAVQRRKEFAQYYPKPGWVEHDPHEIWSSQMAVAIAAMGKMGLNAGILASID